MMTLRRESRLLKITASELKLPYTIVQYTSDGKQNELMIDEWKHNI